MFAGFTPTGKQAEALHSTARWVILSGAMQSGKSVLATAIFVKRILSDIQSDKAHPLTYVGTFNKSCVARLTYWVVSPTYDLAKVVVAYLQSFVPQHLRQDFDAHSQTMWLRTERGYVKIVVRSAEHPDRLIADRCDGILVDESARCDGRIWRGALRSRVATTGGFGIFATSPKDGRANWVFSDLIARQGVDPDIACFTLRAADNPSIDPSEIEAARNSLPSVWFRRDWLGEWASWGSGCYQAFDAKVHTLTEAQLRMEYGIGATGDLRRIVTKAYGGCDFGWSDPSCLLVGLLTVRDELIVTDEFYASNVFVSHSQMKTGTLVAEAWDRQRRWNVSEWRCDGADPEAIGQFTTSGLNAYRANKAIVDGVRKVSVRLHVNSSTRRPRMRILSDRCPRLVDEMGRLSWKMDRNGDAVEGEFSDASPRHAPDALRYMVQEVDRFADDGLPKVPTVVNFPGLGSLVGSRRV